MREQEFEECVLARRNEIHSSATVSGLTQSFLNDFESNIFKALQFPRIERQSRGSADLERYISVALPGTVIHLVLQHP